MTNKRNLRIAIVVTIVAITSTIILTSWDFKQNYAGWSGNNDDYYDTVPKKDAREKKIRDLDDVLDELNNAEIKVDMEKMQKELEATMKQVDAAKIKLDMEKAMKEIDFEKIQRELESSMAKIDFSKIEREMKEAMKQVDAAKIQQEVEASMQKIDWEKMKAEMEKVKEIDFKKMELDFEKMEKELSKIGPELEKSLEKAKISLEKAKAEMEEYKEFVDGLENDGFIDKKKEYTIKHKDGELIINGKKVNSETYKKYKSFLDKHETFTIEKSNDDFNIDID